MKRTFNPGEIEFTATYAEDFNDAELKAALKAAKDRKRRYGWSTYTVLDQAITKLELATEARRCDGLR